MESDQRESIAVMDWESILGGRSRLVAGQGITWQGILLAAIVFLHFALLAYAFSWQAIRSDKLFIPDEALQVSFIDRVSRLETGQSKPNRNMRNEGNNARSRPRGSTANYDADFSGEKAGDEEIPGPPLRLTIESDVWQIDTTVTPKNPLKRQYIAIAGRAEPFIRGIKLAETSSPKQKLEKIGMLFGAVNYDPCEEARNRMASGRAQANELDVEADLRAIELHCRP